jgi:hypothetical protein
MSSRRPLLALLIAMSALAGIVATPALADPVGLGGNPLNVFVDQLGQLQAFRADRTENPGIFYNSTSPTGDVGFFLAFPYDTSPVGQNLKGKVYGFGTGAIGAGMEDYTPKSQGPVTGTGTAADPLTQVTQYADPRHH